MKIMNLGARSFFGKKDGKNIELKPGLKKNVDMDEASCEVIRSMYPKEVLVEELDKRDEEAAKKNNKK